MKKISVLLIVVLLMLVMNVLPGSAGATVGEEQFEDAVKGMISLPLGETAPKGGLEIQVSAYSRYPTKEICSEKFTISEGFNSCNYYLNVPKTDESVSSFCIGFKLLNSSEYVDYGYVFTEIPEKTQAFKIEEAKTMNFDSSVKTENISLIKAKKITGKISLPDNETAPEGGIRVRVNLKAYQYLKTKNHSDEFYDLLASDEFTILKGQKSTEYTLKPYNDLYYFGNLYDCQQFSYYLQYEILDNPNYYSKGFYNGNETVLSNPGKITVFKNTQNVMNLNILKGGKKISGKLYRAEKTDKDLQIRIKAIPESNKAELKDFKFNPGIDYKGEYDTLVTIHAGSDSCDYSVMVPGGKYLIMYFAEKNDTGYIEKSLYSKDGATYYADKAGILTVSKDTGNISLEAKKEAVISGTVRIAGNGVAPKGGIKMVLYAYHDRHNGLSWINPYPGDYELPEYEYKPDARTKEITIPEGKNSVDFSMSADFKSLLSKGYYIGLAWYGKYDTQCVIYDGQLVNEINDLGKDVRKDFETAGRPSYPAVKLTGYIKDGNEGKGFQIKTIDGLGLESTAASNDEGYYVIDNVTKDMNSDVIFSKPGYITRYVKFYADTDGMIGMKDRPVYLFAGDLNNDGAVNMVDFMLESQYFNQDKPEYDFDRDGIINMKDIMLISKNFNKTAGDYERLR